MADQVADKAARWDRPWHEPLFKWQQWHVAAYKTFVGRVQAMLLAVLRAMCKIEDDPLHRAKRLSLIHISEPTRLALI
eukprot:1512088-Alexandrium_andersonii.AAC.1